MTLEKGDRAPGKLDAAIDAFEAAALWLIRCESWRKWMIVVGSIVAVTMLDLSTAAASANFRTLYVVPVALACWTLRPVHAVTVTAATIALLFLKAELSYGTPEFLSLVGSATARTLAYSTVAAFVLSFRRLYDRTLASARQDQMTGVLNKSAFEQEATAMLARNRAADATMLIAVLDLDGFKQLNDEHGHAAGDAVLKNFSLGLAREIRRSDRIGRIGGDEFGLVLQAASAMEGKQLARDIHERVSHVLEATGYAVTVSMGALIVPPGRHRTTALHLEDADGLLYQAKRAGKNTVIVAVAQDDAGTDAARPAPTDDPISLGAASITGARRAILRSSYIGKDQADGRCRKTDHDGFHERADHPAGRVAAAARMERRHEADGRGSGWRRAFEAGAGLRRDAAGRRLRRAALQGQSEDDRRDGRGRPGRSEAATCWRLIPTSSFAT